MNWKEWSCPVQLEGLRKIMKNIKQDIQPLDGVSKI
jgi:hypothetical protein